MGHTLIGFANRFLDCSECGKPTRYWHDPSRCGCDVGWFLYPCEHKADTKSECPSWDPITGCLCEPKGNHS